MKPLSWFNSCWKDQAIFCPSSCVLQHTIQSTPTSLQNLLNMLCNRATPHIPLAKKANRKVDLGRLHVFLLTWRAVLCFINKNGIISWKLRLTELPEFQIPWEKERGSFACLDFLRIAASSPSIGLEVAWLLTTWRLFDIYTLLPSQVILYFLSTSPSSFFMLRHISFASSTLI